MRVALLFTVVAFLLSACGGSQLSPEQKARRDINIAQTNAALAVAKNVSVSGKTFRVAHVTERNQALVDLIGAPAPYTASDVVVAARAATGCDGRFDPGVLAFVGGNIETADLSELRTKVSGRFSGWSVRLNC